MSKNKIILSDSIVYRQMNGRKGLIPYPTLLFGDSIEIDAISHKNTNYITKDEYYLKLKDYEYIIIHLGICDCYPRYRDLDNIDINKYDVRVDIDTFENNIKKLISVLDPNFNKLIIMSIVEPPKQYAIVRNKDYNEIVQKQVTLYNNIYKKYAKKYDYVYWINMNYNLQKKYNINEYLLDNSGHIIENLETIYKYAKLVKKTMEDVHVPIKFNSPF
jgi:hypothetical protein